VSADSRQVYRGLDIGTAKPGAAERAAVPHHGLDLVDPDEPFSAADYRRHALEALAGIAERGRLAMLVGGTGLYLRAMARGLPLERAGSDPDVRARLEVRLRDDGLAALVAELHRRDPAAARAIDLDNPRRVVRALERAIVTGRGTPPEPEGYPAPVRWIGLALDRARHRAAIESRAAGQFEGGLLEEAAGLRDRYRDDLPAFSAMGYREAFGVLAGQTDVATAVARTSVRTWAYARRQRTWFRSEPGIEWLDAGEGITRRTLGVLDPFLRGIGRPVYAGRR